MRLETVRIKGFRCFGQETELSVDKFNAILGRNDVGKSSLLEALQVFFDDSAPDAGDVNMNTDDKEVHIVCEFSELPQTVVLDTDYPTSLDEEFLLRANGRLAIHKVYDGSLKAPKLKGTFVLANHPTADGFADLMKLKNKDLKERAVKVGVDMDKVPKNINAALRQAIRAVAKDLECKEILLDVTEEGTKQVWAQLKEALPIFALFKADRPSTDQDSEAQDPMKTAVQQALKAHEDKLEELRAAVESSVLEVAKLTVSKLAEIDPNLARELKPTVQRPNWATAFKIALTDETEVPVNKRGSGVRRMILLNFFRAQAERRNNAGHGPGVIYAIEEPETSQHPANQKLLLRAFFELAEQPGCQVLITTHNPALARNLPVQSLRLVTRAQDNTRRVLVGNEDVYYQAAKELGVLPDNSVKAFVGVEGTNDINFLKAISAVLAPHEADIPDLAKAEESGQLIFVPLGGSNLENWIGRLAKLNRPEFHLFDRDTIPPAAPRYEAAADRVNNQPGCIAMHTDMREVENYLHPDAIREQWPLIQWQNHAPFTDVPKTLAPLCVNAGGGSWANLDDKARGKAELGIKVKLNRDVAARMTPARLSLADPTGVVRTFLRRIGQALV
jgi:predicted ATPase